MCIFWVVLLVCRGSGAGGMCAYFGRFFWCVAEVVLVACVHILKKATELKSKLKARNDDEKK